MKLEVITEWKTVIEQVNTQLAKFSFLKFSPIEIPWDKIEPENTSQHAKYALSCAEKIDECANKLLDLSSGEGNDKDVEELYFATYIFLRYNECVLRDIGSDEENFLRCLSELNGALDSRIMEKLDASEKLFLSAAKLNFKVHDYAKAKEYAERSIKLEEQNGADSYSNYDLRFQKRCLLAFCCEYTFDPKLNGRGSCSEQKNGLIKAVKHLIGYRPDELLPKGEKETCVLKEIVKKVQGRLEGELDAYAIIEQIYNKEAKNCLAYLILHSYRQFAKDQEIREYVCSLAHVLAHCFSELHKWDVLRNMQRAQYSIYLSRMAEILMESLNEENDDKYITCLSTVLLENEEYDRAIRVMEEKRDALAEKWKEKFRNELAQVDFYIWYFSVITKRYADATVDKNLDIKIEMYRNMFEEYTLVHPEDKEAKIYYELLSMKELLMKCFNALKNGFVSRELFIRLVEKRKTFSNLHPYKSVHKTIRDEWEILLRASRIFLSCNRYNETGNDWYLYDIEHELLSLQHNKEENDFANKPNITNAQKRVSVSERENNIRECYKITWNQGDFLYVGRAQSVAHEMFVRLGIEYEAQYIHESSEKKISDGKIGKALSGVANILFIYNGVNADYLQEICGHIDAANGDQVKYNIFLFVSDGVSTEDLSKIVEKYRFIKSMPNLRTALQYCVLFSALEKCIYRVNKPLEALIISPIETAKTYSDQNFDEAFFLLKGDMGNLDLSDGNDRDDWRDNLSACFSHDDGKIKMKQIKREAFKNLDTSCIDFILLVELLAGSTAGKKRVARTAVYQFKFDQSATPRSIGHTFANKVNDKNPSAEDPVYTSIQQLYEHRQGIYPNKVHGGECEARGGCHSFFYNDRMGYEAVPGRSHEDYTKFAEDVALYLRIDIGKEERDYAIVKVSNTVSGNQYIFCKFRSDATINGAKYCKALSACIEDVDPDDVKSVTEIAQPTVDAETEHEPKNISADNATNEVKQLLQDAIDMIKPYIAQIEGVDRGSYTYERRDAKRKLSQHVYEQLKEIRRRCSFHSNCSDSFIAKVGDAIEEIIKSYESGASSIKAIQEKEKEWTNLIQAQLVVAEQKVDQTIHLLKNILSGV